MIIHDNNLDRTSNRSLNVSALSADELMELDAGSWFDMRFAGERIPKLSTLLKWAKAKKTKAKGPLAYFVELKVDGDESRRELLIRSVTKELKEAKVLDRSVPDFF